MKIKSDYELMTVVSAGLATLSNQVQNGAIEPFQGFMTSDSITVKLTLGPLGELTVEAYDVETQEAEIKTLKKTVKEQEGTISSLTPEPTPEPEPVEEEAPMPKPRRTSK